MPDRDQPPSKFSSNMSLVLWLLISAGVYSIIPREFKFTDGPAGVLALVAAGIVAIPISMFISAMLKRLFNSFR